MRRILAVGTLGLAGLAVGACEDATGIEGGATEVAVEFRSAPASTSATLMGFGGSVAASLSVPGANGELVLDTIHVIIEEFELESTMDDDCSENGDDDCRDFSADPSLVEIPLDGGTATIVSDLIPAGSYDELEFEIENLEDDDDDRGEFADLRDEIRDRFPDWPEEASLRVVGSFTPVGGDPVPFTVYVEAEIEVELEFDTPLVITGDEGSRTITVEIDPALWFQGAGDDVLDLSAYDYETTGLVPELEAEIERGFEGADHDDRDDDDSDDDDSDDDDSDDDDSDDDDSDDDDSDDDD